MKQHRKPISRMALLLSFAVLSLTIPKQATAQYLGNGPVDKFQDALRENLAYPSSLSTDDADRELRKKLLDYRKANLQQRAEKLQSLGEIQDALLLQGWKTDATDPDEAQVDLDVQRLLTDRYTSELRRILDAKGNPADQIAALKLLGSMASEDRRLNKGKGGFVRGFVSKFQDDIAAIVSDKSRPTAVRGEAIKTLGNIYPKAEVETAHLEPLLEGTTPEFQIAIMNALNSLITSAEALVSNQSALPQDRDYLIRVNSIALPILMKGLQPQRDLKVRRAAIQGLYSLADSLSQIRPLLSKEYPPKDRPRTPSEQRDIDIDYDRVQVEEKTLFHLAKGLDENMDPLLKVKESDAEVRLGAREVLEDFAVLLERLEQQRAKLPPKVLPKEGEKPQTLEVSDTLKHFRSAMKKALPALISGIDNTNGVQEKIAALQVLERLGRSAKPAASAVTVTLSDYNNFVRWVSARTIGKISDPNAPVDGSISGLARLLGDVDVGVRNAAAMGIKRFTPTADVAAIAVPALASELMKPRDPNSKETYIETIDHFGDLGKSAIPALIHSLSDEDEDVREKAAIVLGHLGPLAKEAVPALQRAANDSEPLVKLAASKALLSINR